MVKVLAMPGQSMWSSAIYNIIMAASIVLLIGNERVNMNMIRKIMRITTNLLVLTIKKRELTHFFSFSIFNADEARIVLSLLVLLLQPML